jgi:hypothetical protein
VPAYTTAADGSISCPHAATTVCTPCQADPAVVKIGEQFYWIPDPGDRAVLAGAAADELPVRDDR